MIDWLNYPLQWWLTDWLTDSVSGKVSKRCPHAYSCHFFILFILQALFLGCIDWEKKPWISFCHWPWGRRGYRLCFWWKPPKNPAPGQVHSSNLPNWSALEPLPNHDGLLWSLAQMLPIEVEEDKAGGSQWCNGEGSHFFNWTNADFASSHSWVSTSPSDTCTGAKNLCTSDRSHHLVHQIIPLGTFSTQRHKSCYPERPFSSAFDVAPRPTYSIFSGPRKRGKLESLLSLMWDRYGSSENSSRDKSDQMHNIGRMSLSALLDIPPSQLALSKCLAGGPCQNWLPQPGASTPPPFCLSDPGGCSHIYFKPPAQQHHEEQHYFWHLLSLVWQRWLRRLVLSKLDLSARKECPLEACLGYGSFARLRLFYFHRRGCQPWKCGRFIPLLETRYE